jgi:Dolichyl-phosphate-mannose-protein mannosyltransferase
LDNGPTPRPTQPSALAATDAASAPASHRQAQPGRRLRLPASWPLVLILAAQVILSIRLVRADSAFEDEATYLWAGHLEWSNWLHGTAIPPFAAYFSGAPVIYPPLGALADSIGGLVAARILSLVFMLGATTLLWATANRLFGRMAAVFGAALFAALGPTLHLGAFATYDPLSVFLVALAAWIVVRAAGRRDATGAMIAAGCVLAVANAASYSSTLFDLVVILLALLTALPEVGGKLAAARSLTILIVVTVLVTAGLLIGGSSYIHGVETTTVDRVPGGASASTVLADAWWWTGFVVAAACCGLAISLFRRERRVQSSLLALLAVSALIGPLEQARLQTSASLDKHVGLGAWFAAIAAGYAVDKLIAAAPAGSTRMVTCGACVVALALPVSVGASQSEQFSTSWPNSADFIAILRPLVDHSTGRLLVEDPSVAEYYLHAESQWKRWSSTRNIVLQSGASSGGPSSAAGVVGPGNAGTYQLKIEHSYFELVALNYIDTTALDLKITADLKQSHHYCVIQVVPYGDNVPPIGVGDYVIWQYQQAHFKPASTGWSCR